MKGLTPTIRLSLGLVLLTVSSLLLADLLHILPSQRYAIAEARKTLCQSLAVQYSAAVEAHNLPIVIHSMESIVEHVDDVRSLRLRTITGQVLAESGAHLAENAESKSASMRHPAVIPIFRDGERWGSVEVGFERVAGTGVLGLPWGGLLETLLFVSAFCFALYLLLIRRVLAHVESAPDAPLRAENSEEIVDEGSSSAGMRLVNVPATLVGSAPSKETTALPDVGRSRSTIQEPDDRIADSILEARVEARTTTLQENLAAATAAQRVKSAFTAKFSDDLRTQLREILSLAQFGRRRCEAGDHTDLLSLFEGIQRNGGSLFGLLNNILDLSTFPVEKASFSWGENDLAVIVRSVIQEFEVLAESAGVEIEFFEPSVRTEGIFDRERITQVVRNVLANAILFSGSGSRVTVGLVEGAPIKKGQARALRLWIEDEGVGIPEDQLELIFEPFTHSRRTDADACGSGLGLAMCREIISAHGGRILAKNRAEGGARFEIRIPRGQISELA